MVQKKGFFEGFRPRNLRGSQNRLRLARFIIFIGFVIVGIVFLSVFIPRAGLNVEIIERKEVVGTMELISIRVSNNNFETLNDVTIQFGDNGKIQPVGTMGPFSSIMITPDNRDLNFDKIIVKWNNGAMQYIKSR